jgi:hypothetical protein
VVLAGYVPAPYPPPTAVRESNTELPPWFPRPPLAADVPPAPPGEPYIMMIMSIAFDKNDTLYGTAIVGFCQICDPMNSPIMRIDPTTGEGTLLGYSLLGYNHGGDTRPTKVRVAHLADDGQYHCQWISLDALPAHLAHGDYVPGTDGHSCDCP